MDLLDNFEVQLHLAAAAGRRKYESGRLSFASCPLMAHPITSTPALNRTCAQEAWMYFGYTTETGYALLAHPGSLSCPQPHSRRFKGDRRKMCASADLGTNAGVPLSRIYVFFSHFLLMDLMRTGFFCFFSGLHLLIFWVIWGKNS